MRSLEIAASSGSDAGASAIFHDSPAQEQRWAAIDPNHEASSPVAWVAHGDEGAAGAVEACKRVSKTCANGPASTNDMDDVFAVMCCTSRGGVALWASQAPAGGAKKRAEDVCRMLGTPIVRCGTICRLRPAGSSDRASRGEPWHRIAEAHVS